MIGWLTFLLRLAVTGLKSRRNLLLENLALRHQLLVLPSRLNSSIQGFKVGVYCAAPAVIMALAGKT